jgi:hypothetical protein
MKKKPKNLWLHLELPAGWYFGLFHRENAQVAWHNMQISFKDCGLDIVFGNQLDRGVFWHLFEHNQIPGLQRSS